MAADPLSPAQRTALEAARWLLTNTASFDRFAPTDWMFKRVDVVVQLDALLAPTPGETAPAETGSDWDVLQATRAERDALRARVQQLTEAGAALVAKLDECEPRINAAVTIAFVHGFVYDGPTYGEELTAFRAALTPPAPTEGSNG